MPRSKSRRKRKRASPRGATAGGAPRRSIAWGAAAGEGGATAAAARRKSLPWRPILGAGAVVIVAALAWWWDTRQAAKNFEALAARGAPILERIETMRDEGGGHLPQGQGIPYQSDPPTSGPHWPTPTEAGFYADRQWPEALVHALEHGNIVIYYDAPGEESLTTIRGWTGLYRGVWDGVVATPKPGLATEIILTAWRRVLRLDPFDSAGAAAFIDRFRGRGPENAVR